MPHFVREYLRQRRCDRVVRNGQRLRKAQAERYRVADDRESTVFIDAEIDRLTRRVEADLRYIKETSNVRN